MPSQFQAKPGGKSMLWLVGLFGPSSLYQPTCERRKSTLQFKHERAFHIDSKIENPHCMDLTLSPSMVLACRGWKSYPLEIVFSCRVWSKLQYGMAQEEMHCDEKFQVSVPMTDDSVGDFALNWEVGKPSWILVPNPHSLTLIHLFAFSNPWSCLKLGCRWWTNFSFF